MANLTLRATVVSTGALNQGAPVQVLIDGADTPVTANGLTGYQPFNGDRVLVSLVGGVLEIVQFLTGGDSTFGNGGTGIRIEDDSSAGIIKFYCGITGETPGYINPGLDPATNKPSVFISSGREGSDSLAEIRLASDALSSGIVTITGRVFVDGPQTQLSSLQVLDGQVELDSGLNPCQIKFTNSLGGTNTIQGQTGYLDFMLEDSTNTPDGTLRMRGGSNIAGKLSTAFTSAIGCCIAFNGNAAIIGDQAYNDPSPSASNTGALHAADIHSWTGGVTMEDLSGGGLTGASIDNTGRVVRTTSSRRYKRKVQPMSLRQARKVLDLEPVTFERRGEPTGTRYPGFIAEQAHESGNELWVSYDAQGRPDGVRYPEVTVAHNALLRDLIARIERLEQK